MYEVNVSSMMLDVGVYAVVFYSLDFYVLSFTVLELEPIRVRSLSPFLEGIKF